MLQQLQRCINSLARGNGSWAKDANCLSNRSRLQQRFVLKQLFRVIWFKIYYFTWAVVRFPNWEEGRGNLTRWWSAAEDRLVIKSTTSVPKFQFFLQVVLRVLIVPKCNQNETKMWSKCDPKNLPNPPVSHQSTRVPVGACRWQDRLLPDHATARDA